jgi:ABC-2 type transport system ATP-binding protein
MMNAMASVPVIETHKLTKRYGSFEAVSRLDMCIRAGSITGFLGRNGAGKSSTIKMLLGIIRPSSGTGLLLGRDIADPSECRKSRESIAYVAEDKNIYGYMTVAQAIAFTRSFYSDWDTDNERRLLKQFELPPNRKVKALSKGMRTKLALLLALSRHPQLLILDEPSEGLDPVSIEEFLRSLVTVAADGTTVFFSSHQIAEVERVADRVCIVDHGRLVADTSIEEIRQDYRRITFGFLTDPPPLHFSDQSVQSMHIDGKQVTVLSVRNTDEVIQCGRAFGAATVETTPISLRELFLSSVKEDGHHALV